MHDKYARVRLLALGLALTSAAAAATGVRTVAGPLPPYRVSRVVAEVLGGPRMGAIDVNNAGEVLAWRLALPGVEGVRWRAGMWQSLGPGDFGGLNDLSQVAGEVAGRATVWDSAGTPLALPFPTWGPGCEPRSTASKISGAGHVIGTVFCEGTLRSVFWTSFVALPQPVSPPAGHLRVELRDVNRRGAITGYTDGPVVHGFVRLDGVYRRVPVTGADTTQPIYPAAISDTGYVAGTAGTLQPFIWDGVAARSTSILWKTGFTGVGDDVNDDGVVSGSLRPEWAPATTFIWHRDFGLRRLTPPAGALPTGGYCDGASISDISKTNVFTVVATCHDGALLQSSVVKWTVSLARSVFMTPLMP